MFKFLFDWLFYNPPPRKHVGISPRRQPVKKPESSSGVTPASASLVAPEGD